MSLLTENDLYKITETDLCTYPTRTAPLLRDSILKALKEFTTPYFSEKGFYQTQETLWFKLGLEKIIGTSVFVDTKTFPLSYLLTRWDIIEAFEKLKEEVYVEYIADNSPRIPQQGHPWGPQVLQRTSVWCQATTYDIWCISHKLQIFMSSLAQEQLINLITGDEDGIRIGQTAFKKFGELMQNLEIRTDPQKDLDVRFVY